MRRRPTALLASVTLHATVVAWVWTRTSVAPPGAAPPTRVAVTIVERPTPPPRPVEPPPVRRRTPAPQRPRAPAALASPSPVPPLESPALESPAVVATPSPPVVTAPTETTPTPTAPKLDLFAPDALRGGLSIRVPDGPAPPERLGLLPGEKAGRDATTEAERVAARITGAGIDQAARARVQGGLVDPSYARLGRAMLDAWDPDRALPETTAEMWAKRRAQNAAVGMKLWQESAANYATTGSPLADGERLAESADSNVREVNSAVPGLDARRTRDTYGNYMRGKFNEGRSAFVLVEQETDGTVHVSLVQSSGDPQIDRAAVEDIRAAMTRLTASGTPFAGARRSLWSLRLQIVINPPLPVLGFTFDEVLEVPKLELPLGRKLLKRVQLEAVYDDDPRLATGADDAPAPDTAQAAD